MATSALVTGAGGFIGHHLVDYLSDRGYWVRGVDLKRPEFGPTAAHEFLILDLRQGNNALQATDGVEEAYHLAADMGGIGYITSNHADITRHNALINLNTIEAARANGVGRFLFSSSACVYPSFRQDTADVTALREADAWPADPEPGYGLEKLFMEEVCRYYQRDYGLETRIVRFHNVYGPLGTYEGGKEKAPAAICRKIACAEDGDTIEVWGDGKQTRSFLYISDCVDGIHRLMRSQWREPLNLGTDRLVTVDELVDIVARIAQKVIHKRHDPSRPQGVRGRNSDNTLLREVLGWEPSVTLEKGLAETYRWIEAQVNEVRDRDTAPAEAAS